MDIHTNLDGVLKVLEKHDGIDKLFVLELPIIFKNFSSGPRGLTSVSLIETEIDRKIIYTNSTVSIHPYKINLESKKISGDSILTRPVYFRSEDGGTDNILVFSVLLENRDKYMSIFNMGADLVMKLKINFTNFQNIELLISGEIKSKSGDLMIKSIERASKNPLVLYNLLGLSLVLVSLFYWNFWLNNDVYEAKMIWQQKTITIILGSIGTFFGLSIGKIKSFVTTITQFNSVRKYPELHLNIELFRNLSSITWSILLGMVTVVASALVIYYWSIKTPEFRGFSIYDTIKGQIVNTKRMYIKDLRNEKRFVIICNDKELVGNPYKLGFIGKRGKLLENNIVVKYYKGRNISNPKTLKLSALELYNKSSLFDLSLSFNDIICGTEFKEKISKQNYLLKLANEDSSKLCLSSIEIRDFKETTYSELTQLINQFKADELSKKETGKLFEERLNLIREIKNSLLNQIEENGIVQHESILKIINDELNSILSNKKDPNKRIIERNIILTGLLRATIDSRTNTLSNGEIASICNKIGNLLKIDYGWVENRSLVEFLLEIKTLFPIETKDLTHNCLIKNWINKSEVSEADIISRSREYFVISSMKEYTKLDFAFKYFNDNYESIVKTLVFNDNDFFEELIKIERDRRMGKLIWDEINIKKMKNAINRLISLRS